MQSSPSLETMTRAIIRREVASIRPFDELEESHRVDALAWIDSGAPLCRTAKSRSIEVKTSHLIAKNLRGLSGSGIRTYRDSVAIRTWGDFWRSSVPGNPANWNLLGWPQNEA